MGCLMIWPSWPSEPPERPAWMDDGPVVLMCTDCDEDYLVGQSCVCSEPSAEDFDTINEAA